MGGIEIRTGPRPGDLGTVLAMHGRLYAREYGFDERFEAHVARGLAAFAAALGDARDTGAEPGVLWVAERGDDPVGTVALTGEGGGVAQLRWFLVAPSARGTGLGRELLRTLLDHARGRGYAHVKLWTVDGLDAAARLYTEAGFRRTERNPVRQWGHDLTEARYDLDL
ncbi:acetyltransferase (GNAT) family protein [Saccharopolyspora erythraea NRRL 2338]|uniref:Transcriptional regulator, MarR family with acetyltransferase activity n=2 Tax=Saccharopolyspora erythraea TaxID=1836 RepID=A4F6H9_SACEN|nr:GNAT family N-acetyltransferase [Saccharopolyspora erythraea]EQD85405.1 MarR family transcriptional regulator [Saccharopolyspora erythraea D]PFG93456.1 acetyltransferase (GNAT) family protein [Saccharopolyspora erythraea NRRL 2338]QRK90326.1 GNAT family N-acetyltransferase [Saccharopolyspora erythraea]CAL99653.1 transcriptional regulator, MarR family with acetyltransferase activity [Saccharopolyspora erythraea NRRL 2338]